MADSISVGSFVRRLRAGCLGGRRARSDHAIRADKNNNANNINKRITVTNTERDNWMSSIITHRWLQSGAVRFSSVGSPFVAPPLGRPAPIRLRVLIGPTFNSNEQPRRRAKDRNHPKTITQQSPALSAARSSARCIQNLSMSSSSSDPSLCCVCVFCGAPFDGEFQASCPRCRRRRPSLAGANHLK
jgi:hypothetical protein